MYISYSLEVMESALDYTAEVDIDLTAGPITLAPLSSGTIINGGGMQTVVSDAAFFRVVSDKTQQYGYDIGYYTDVVGGIAVDRMYGAGGGTPLGGTNSGFLNYVGGAYSVGGSPFIIKGYMIYAYSTTATQSPRPAGTLSESAGICTSIGGTTTGRYLINIDNSTASGTSSKSFNVFVTGQRESGNANEIGISFGQYSYGPTQAEIITHDNDNNNIQNVDRLCVMIVY